MKETVTWEADWLKARDAFCERFRREYPGVPLGEYGLQVTGRKDGSDFDEMARLLGLVIGNARFECGSERVFVDFDVYERDDGEITAVVVMIHPKDVDTSGWAKTGFSDDHRPDRAVFWDAARGELATVFARGGFRQGASRDMSIIMVEFEPGEIAA